MKIRYITTALDAPKWKAVADRMFGAMGEEGVLPDDPSPPTTAERAIVAMDGDIPVGMAVFWHLENGAMTWLHLLYVEKSYRNQGIGGQLVGRTMAVARQDGKLRLGLGTGVNNRPMQSLAKIYGLTTVGVLMQVGIVDQGADA